MSEKRWNVGDVLQHPVGSQWELIEHLGGEHDDWRGRCIVAHCTPGYEQHGEPVGTERTFHREYMDRTFTKVVPAKEHLQVGGEAGRKISADDLTKALERALDAQSGLADPEAAGFEPNAIRDFLAFIRAHGGIEVPAGPTENAPVHYGSLMAGLAMGAVAVSIAAEHPLDSEGAGRKVTRTGHEVSAIYEDTYFGGAYAVLGETDTGEVEVEQVVKGKGGKHYVVGDRWTHRTALDHTSRKIGYVNRHPHPALSKEQQVTETVFEPGDKVHVYDECENYIGFDGVIDMLWETRGGLEFYRVTMPNGMQEIFPEMQLAEVSE